MAAGLQELLDRVRRIKRTDDVQHALDKSDLVDLVKGVQGFSFFQPGQQPDKDALRQRYFAKIETAARSFFNSLLASSSSPLVELVDTALIEPVFYIHRPSRVCPNMGSSRCCLDTVRYGCVRLNLHPLLERD